MASHAIVFPSCSGTPKGPPSLWSSFSNSAMALTVSTLTIGGEDHGQVLLVEGAHVEEQAGCPCGPEAQCGHFSIQRQVLVKQSCKGAGVLAEGVIRLFLKVVDN